MAQCRDGGLGYNQAQCKDCDHQEWYPSSCGDRHCPKCLGPRQGKWSDHVCQRLPDCPHFHVVFTLPEPVHAFFERNYQIAAGVLFSAAAETLKQFQTNNWKLRSGFLAVLHTWGQRLNWHPHLHVLVSSGGEDLSTGRWRSARSNYLFPVKAMSKVMRGIFLRCLEELEDDEGVFWPEELKSVEQRRNWRVQLARESWNIFSRPTLGNTRSVVRYLARYTSRIAISNRRITRVDATERTVTFEWKDYRHNGQRRETTMGGGAFLRQFTRHLVPKGLRRVRYYGLLAKPCGEAYQIDGGPGRCIAERCLPKKPHVCSQCQGQNWSYQALYCEVDTSLIECLFDLSSYGESRSKSKQQSYSLEAPRAGPS